MKYTFKNGTSVEGTLEQISEIAKTFKETLDLSKIGGPLPRGHYVSETKGLIKIADMPDMHIRNALLKQSTRHFSRLQKTKGLKNSEFLKEYTKLPENPIVEDLYSELSKRKS